MCDCNVEITRLKTVLAMEKLKTKLYRQIIEQKLDIKLDDKTDEFVNEILLKKIKKLEPTENDNAQKRSSPTFCKKTYKAPPKSFEIHEEPSTELVQETIKSCHETINKMAKDVFGDFDADLCTDEIKNSFDSLKDARAYNNILLNIKRVRNSFQTILDPKEYSSLVESHIVKLKLIFSGKGFTEKKIQSLFQNFLTSLEYRLVQMDGFEKKSIEPEDIEKFKFSVKAGANYPKTFRVFNQTDFLNYFLNYSLCLFPVKDIFEMFVNNPYGFKNVIYIPMNTDEGPYSFYVLNKIENGKRFWKMDCRLDLLTTELSESVKNYSIQLFRKIYKKCVNTNTYIVWANCMTKFQALEFDCVQLLRNFFLCIDFSKINEVLKNCVRMNCIKQTTSNDKFDLYNDDKETMIHMRDFKMNKEDIIENVKLLFDEIDDATCMEFYTHITN